MKNPILIVAMFFATVFTISFAASCESNTQATTEATTTADSTKLDTAAVPGTFGIDTIVIADTAK